MLVKVPKKFILMSPFLTITGILAIILPTAFYYRPQIIQQIKDYRQEYLLKHPEEREEYEKKLASIRKKMGRE